MGGYGLNPCARSQSETDGNPLHLPSNLLHSPPWLRMLNCHRIIECTFSHEAPDGVEDRVGKRPRQIIHVLILLWSCQERCDPWRRDKFPRLSCHPTTNGIFEYQIRKRTRRHFCRSLSISRFLLAVSNILLPVRLLRLAPVECH